jgi:hypothetical protein
VRAPKGPHATGEDRVTSITADADSYGQDPLAPLIDLALELRPTLPYTVAQSLVIEALDLCADLILCQDWAEKWRDSRALRSGGEAGEHR